MPLNNFFTYQIISQDSANIKVRINYDPGHKLYQGHFPDQPVTPGVVLIEILRQVLSMSLNKKLMLSMAREIKYLAPVLPGETNHIDYNIDYSVVEGSISAYCIISWQEKVFTKIKGVFREE
jgi:3-hydroxyacyl-[acyl-carrier-protein] dehydratase